MFVPAQTTRFSKPNRLQNSGSGGYNFVDCGSMTFRYHSSRPDATSRDFPLGTVPKDTFRRLSSLSQNKTRRERRTLNKYRSHVAKRASSPDTFFAPVRKREKNKVQAVANGETDEEPDWSRYN
ncbi:unnamed protein product [Mucor circinelloides]